MAEPQAEPFHVALTALRERLQSGALSPGARATAVDLADELGLSTTPVREALSRLTGRASSRIGGAKATLSGGWAPSTSPTSTE